jgi:hypothetical protein
LILKLCKTIPVPQPILRNLTGNSAPPLTRHFPYRYGTFETQFQLDWGRGRLYPPPPHHFGPALRAPSPPLWCALPPPIWAGKQQTEWWVSEPTFFSFSAHTYTVNWCHANTCLITVHILIQDSILFVSKPPAPFALPLAGVWPDPKFGLLLHLSWIQPPLNPTPTPKSRVSPSS